MVGRDRQTHGGNIEKEAITAMDNEDRAKEVRQRMAALRRELECDVEGVATSARAMADWRFYVERFPLAAAGLAAAVGFLAVPKRSQVIVPDADTLAEMAKKNRVWVKTGSPKATERERGVLASVLALVASGAAKAAVSWASQQMKSSFAAQQNAANAGADGRSTSSHLPPR